jgi:hypothetical protein
MDQTDTMLVPYSMVPVGEGQHPYPYDALWADPDIDAAARMMRSIVAGPDAARQRADRARARLGSAYSAERAAASIAARLREPEPVSKRQRRGWRGGG